MTVVKELASLDQRIEGPGVFVLLDGHTYGIKPERRGELECIPFSWATEFPPVGDFVQRFPTYWTTRPYLEVWMGGVYNPGGIYWDRYNPQQLRKVP